MRTFKDAKAMAKSLRDELALKNVSLTHTECLELVARQLGFADWNTVAPKLQSAALPATIDKLSSADRHATGPAGRRPPFDVVFCVYLVKDGRAIASPCLLSEFGREVSVEFDNIMRVSALSSTPDEQGRSATRVSLSVFDGNGWTLPKKMSGSMALSKTPSFQYSVPDTAFRFEIMPRQVVAWSAS